MINHFLSLDVNDSPSLTVLTAFVTFVVVFALTSAVV